MLGAGKSNKPAPSGRMEDMRNNDLDAAEGILTGLVITIGFFWAPLAVLYMLGHVLGWW